MKLPTVRGSNLLRQSMRFPDDFAGELNLVFIAFLREHQDQVDAWVPFVEGLAGEYPQLSYYEFPTLPRRGLIYRTLLNEGMRAGIPDKATRARTITLYLDKDAFKQALDINSERDMWVYVFDRSGNVMWRTEGSITDEKRAALRDLLRQAT